MVNRRKRTEQAARQQQCASSYACQHFTQTGRVPAATALHQACANTILNTSDMLLQLICCRTSAWCAVFTFFCSARLV